MLPEISGGNRREFRDLGSDLLAQRHGVEQARTPCQIHKNPAIGSGFLWGTNRCMGALG